MSCPVDSLQSHLPASFFLFSTNSKLLWGRGVPASAKEAAGICLSVPFFVAGLIRPRPCLGYNCPVSAMPLPMLSSPECLLPHPGSSQLQGRDSHNQIVFQVLWHKQVAGQLVPFSIVLMGF